MAKNEQIFSAKEASEYLGVSYKVLVNKLIKHIPHIRYTENGRIKFRKSTLDEYIEIQEKITLNKINMWNMDAEESKALYKKRQKFNI